MNEDEDNPPTSRWRPAIDAITADLAAHLAQRVTVLRTSEMEDAFFCSIRGPEPSWPTLQVAWEGALGMEYIDDKPDVSAALFLYSRGRRLRLDD
ncbi:hypothetical protein [Actinomadura fibrosa]|uniref:Uncharacterized protein n=1 Tax=Actinomadura fibrosa TaxID=111802 RepID=A0ABW2XVX6_9ACTN|nr:hypothetical protein [Actinomadura fibrosa]